MRISESSLCGKPETKDCSSIMPPCSDEPDKVAKRHALEHGWQLSRVNGLWLVVAPGEEQE